MTITAAPLHDWSFDELVREGLSLIPGHAPDWTNHNPSDPGITLVELLAYLTEVLIYRLGRVTPHAKLQFLCLLKGAGWTEWLDLTDCSAEMIDRKLAEAVRELGQHDCAVTATDFEQLAMEKARYHLGPQVQVRALCIPGIHLDAEAGARSGMDTLAHVTVVLLPQRELGEEAMAQLCTQVHEGLRPHCLLTTRLHVTGPLYLHVGIGFRIRLRPGARWQAVQEAVTERLNQRFGFRPAEDSSGLPLPPGSPLHLMDITHIVDTTEGVDFVEDVTVLAMSRHKRDLQDTSSRIGIQIGITSTLAVDSWLGMVDCLGTQRLVRDDAGRLVSLLLQPWEVVRLHLVSLDTESRDEGGNDGQ